jgi:hypothetical protein
VTRCRRGTNGKEGKEDGVNVCIHDGFGGEFTGCVPLSSLQAKLKDDPTVRPQVLKLIF